MIKQTINGVEYTLVTVTELASMLGIKTNTIRVYEKRGIIPPPNIRGSEKVGPTETGIRLYTKELAEKLVPLLGEEVRGKNYTEEDKKAIRHEFATERRAFK